MLATGEEAPQYLDGLRAQMDVAQAILTGLGYEGAHFSLLRSTLQGSHSRWGSNWGWGHNGIHWQPPSNAALRWQVIPNGLIQQSRLNLWQRLRIKRLQLSPACGSNLLLSRSGHLLSCWPLHRHDAASNRLQNLAHRHLSLS